MQTGLMSHRAWLVICAYGKHWPFRENERKKWGKEKVCVCVELWSQSMTAGVPLNSSDSRVSKYVSLCVQWMSRGLSYTTISFAGWGRVRVFRLSALVCHCCLCHIANLSTFKWVVFPKILILSSVTHHHNIPYQNELLCFFEHILRC